MTIKIALFSRRTSTLVAGLAALLASGCARPKQLVRAAPLSSRAAAIVGAAQEKLYSDGRPAKAAELARQALALDQNAAGAHEVLAQIAMLSDDLKAAFEHWLGALADARSPHVALYLTRIPHRLLRRAQRERLLALLREIAARHPSKPARATAARYVVALSVGLGDHATARRMLGQLGLLRRFRAIAGFDNTQNKGYDTPYAPETETQLERTYPGQRGRVGWRRIAHRGPLASLDLRDFFYPFHSSVAYLLTYLETAKPRTLLLHVTTTDPIKVWINDRSVLATRRVRYAGLEQLVVPVRLAAGYNKVLVKSCQGSGSWRVSLALRERDGAVAGGISDSDTPQPYVRDKRRPARFTPLAALRPSIRALRRGSRRSYWAAVSLATSGLRRIASAGLTRHLVRWPRDVMALALATRIARAEQRLQRAAQLVDLGKRLPAPYNTFFLIERARLYRQRGQYDRAFEVLGKARTAVKAAALAKLDAAGAQRQVYRELNRLYVRKGWSVDRCRLGHALQRVLPDALLPVAILASCNSSLGRVDQAHRWLLAAARLAPASRSLNARLARSLAQLGRCSDALDVARDVVAKWPTNLHRRMALGHLYRRCGDPARAMAAYAHARRQAPRWDRPYRAIGLLHFEAGRVAKALVSWRSALDRNPDDSRLWDRVTHLSPSNDPILEKYRPREADIARAIAAGRSVTPMEGASVVWLLDHEVSRLMDDGTLKRVVTIIRRAVDRHGRDALGQTKLPRRGLVKVIEAYSVDRRGRRREVTSMHGRVVRYPTLSEGAIVVLQYRHIRNPAGYLRHHLANSWYFQHPLGQVVRAEWKLAMSAGRKLRVAVQGKVQHSKQSAGKLALHTFSARDVPPLRPERRSLPTRDLLRSVTVSTVPSWDYFSSWGRSLTEDVFEIGPLLERLLTRLLRGAKTRAEKVRRIYHYAVKNVRYQQDYETFIAGVKPHPAAVVLARGYGDCKDKSVLIIALLRKIGIKAHLALIRTRRVGRVMPKVPSQQFNHAVAYLPPQKGFPKGRFLDATAETLDIDTLRHDTQGTLALVLFPRGHKLVPVPYQRPERNRLQMVINLALDKSGSARAVGTLELVGHRAGRLRKPLQNRQQLKQYGQLIAAALYPDSSLDHVDASGARSVLRPLKITLKARSVGAAREEDGALRLRVPRLLGALPTGSAPWSKRRHPLFFGPPTLVIGKLNVKLPAGVKVQSRPKDIALRGPCFDVVGRWSEDRKLGALRYVQTARRTCAVLPAASYQRFRATVKRLKRALESEIVLSLGKGNKRKRRKRRRSSKKTRSRKKR